MGSPKIFNFWGERRHKSPNVASDILCDLVAERESFPSPCKKKCEILLQFQRATYALGRDSSILLVPLAFFINFRLPFPCLDCAHRAHF